MSIARNQGQVVLDGDRRELCKPNKRGAEDKKTARDPRFAMKHEQELRDAGAIA